MDSNTTGSKRKVGRRKVVNKCNVRVVTYFDEEMKKKIEAYGKDLGIKYHGGVVKCIVHLFFSKNPQPQITMQ